MIVTEDIDFDPVFPFVLCCDGCGRNRFYSRATDELRGLVAAADAGWTIAIHGTADTAVDRHYCRLCTRKRT